ncbi:MAG TPA: hypothetical protein HA282_05215 [Nanoarchaeota archaeon]|nr:hypothetical protein [Nanoarchaeota archaeon]HIH66581.1 hypothetical protein [Nanoarchaeota archaeon]
MMQAAYGVGWSRSIDEYMLREEAFRIIDISDSISAILLESETEKAGVTGFVDHQYFFERRRLKFKFSRFCDGPRRITVHYDRKCVFFADEETSYHPNFDMHAKDAMTIETEENAFLEGEWGSGKPEWLKEIEKLYSLAIRFDARRDKLEQKPLNNPRA